MQISIVDFLLTVIVRGVKSISHREGGIFPPPVKETQFFKHVVPIFSLRVIMISELLLCNSMNLWNTSFSTSIIIKWFHRWVLWCFIKCTNISSYWGSYVNWLVPKLNFGNFWIQRNHFEFKYLHYWNICILLYGSILIVIKTDNDRFVNFLSLKGKGLLTLTYMGGQFLGRQFFCWLC